MGTRYRIFLSVQLGSESIALLQEKLVEMVHSFLHTGFASQSEHKKCKKTSQDKNSLRNVVQQFSGHFWFWTSSAI